MDEMGGVIQRIFDDTNKIDLGPTSLITIAIVLILAVVTLIALTVAQKKLKEKFEKTNDLRRTHIYRIVFRIIRILVVLTAIIAILQTVGIRLTGVSAGLAVLVLLLALAVKDALQDVFAGIVIISDKYFNVGDAVEFEGKEGIVVSFTARTTKIEMIDDRSLLSVANRNISKIRKLTHIVDVDLPLPYELSGREAHMYILGICRRIKAIDGVENCELKGTYDFGASAIIYKIRFYCDPHDRLDIRCAVLKTIQDGLEEVDIHIPYQQIDIHQK